jgi:hypothetical protein
MSFHSDHTKPLFLIQPRLDAAEYRDKFIGSAVKYPKRPTEVYAPYEPKVLPKDLVARLDPKPVVIHDVSFFSNRISDKSIQASFNGILEGFAKSAKQTLNHNVATHARLWHMDFPGRKFEALLENETYYNELYDMINENGKLYFVTDIVTLVNLTVINEVSSEAGAGAGVKVPVDPSIGIDVRAGGQILHGKAAGSSGTYEGEMIVLMGYREVWLEKVKGLRAKFNRSLGSPRRGFTVKDAEMRPRINETPAEGDTDVMLGDENASKDSKEGSPTQDYHTITKELGFDVEIK